MDYRVDCNALYSLEIVVKIDYDPFFLDQTENTFY